MSIAKRTSTFRNAFLTITAATLALSTVLPQPVWSASENASTTVSGPQLDAKSSKVVKGMSDFYKGLKAFTMTMSTDMHLASATKATTIGSVFKVSFERPNKFYMNLETGKLGGKMVSDGKTVTLFSPTVSKYIVLPAPQNLANVFNTLDYQVVGGGFSSMSLLETMCDTNPYDQIMTDVDKVEYIAAEKLGDKDCDHVRFTQRDMSWDLWVRQGAQPWIEKVTADMSKIFARKQTASDQLKNLKSILTCTYSNIQPNVGPAADLLTFKAPEGASEVKSFFDKDSTPKTHPLVNTQAPQFELDTLDGSKFDISANKGKIVVLDFWATWCEPCVRALQMVTEVTSTFKNKDVVLLSINVQESPDKINEFMNKTNITAPVGLDQDGEVAAKFQVRGIPQTVVIGKDGKIAEVHVGYGEDRRDRLIKDLTALINGTATESSAKEAEGKKD